MTRPELVWNDARDAKLRELVAAVGSRGECIAPLNALPGAPITNVRQVAYRMRMLRLTLTGESRRASWTAAMMTGREMTYTAPRLAHLREAYPAGVAPRVIMDALNAMPGPQIKSPEALGAFANKIGLKRPVRTFDPAAHKVRQVEQKRAARAAARQQRPAELAPVMKKRALVPQPVQAAEPEPAPVIQPSPEIADAAVEARYARVRAALRKKGSDAAALARVHGMPLREAFRLAGEVRREMRA